MPVPIVLALRIIGAHLLTRSVVGICLAADSWDQVAVAPVCRASQRVEDYVQETVGLTPWVSANADLIILRELSVPTTNTDLSDIRYALDICYDVLHRRNHFLGIRLLPRTHTYCLDAGARRRSTWDQQRIRSRTQRCRNTSFRWFPWFCCLGTSLPSLSTCSRLCTSCLDINIVRCGLCSVFLDIHVVRWDQRLVPKHI